MTLFALARARPGESDSAAPASGRGADLDQKDTNSRAGAAGAQGAYRI